MTSPLNAKILSFLSATALLAVSLPLSAKEAAPPPEKDREAILAMAGEYEVLFNFRETAGYTQGYVLKDEYQEEATELVLVIEDSGSRIALQHLLQVGGGRVIKHWKQVWTWQDRRIVEFAGDDKWTVRNLSSEQAAGTWSQLVTQVDDSPRYESYGRWQHDFGLSRWTSGETARPLPRRELSTRDDYDILMGINRHVLTPYGWIHEQENIKLALERDGKPAHYIARETGVNHYDRTDEHDFTPAIDYWTATQGFWESVSEQWDEMMDQASKFSVNPKIDKKPLWRSMFDVASSLTPGKETEEKGNASPPPLTPQQQQQQIGELLERYVTRTAQPGA